MVPRLSARSGHMTRVEGSSDSSSQALLTAGAATALLLCGGQAFCTAPSTVTPTTVRSVPLRVAVPLNSIANEAATTATLRTPSSLASVLGLVVLGAARRVGRMRQRSRTGRRSVAANSSLLKNLKEFFVSKLTGAPEDEGSSTASDGKSQPLRIRVSSRMPIGQPFCGEYEELPTRLRDRGVFKKLGLLIRL
jgi:hypothetical protein